ncbi:hypothetical protein LNTAR_09304 [Lentisphaera araneosa HTCC2155]|uniref:LamG-like jellyroll fold domain-containing protein n=1 Tax=Lentisphaera araneosa HTCC2155 TaxID=313628 RepID=A6DIA2_9BACT|nr:LamG domain-containing protein [Lentisphaera araneosa]EDM28756.1 hypothetical protein LNTAR_09304 [Lentisphaera araneosa HTCC2155]
MKKFFTLLLILSSSLFAQNATPHYLDRYDPVAIWTLDQDIESQPPKETSGQYKVRVNGDKTKGLPKQVSGARDFLGQALDFSNVGSSIMTQIDSGRLATIGDINNTRGTSLAFWMKLHKDQIQKNHRIIGHPAFEPGLSGWGYGGLSGHMGAGFRVGFTKYMEQRDIAFDGNWHHIVITVDYQSRRKNVKLYLDGQFVTANDGASNKSFNHAKRMFIGARSNGGNSFPGALDDVSVYDYPLNADQILEMYHGPVFAGSAKVHYLPEALQLNAIAPADAQVLWLKNSGPGNVSINNKTRTNAKVTFSKPGDYTLSFKVKGHQSQSLQVKVHPATAPDVYAGDAVELNAIQESYQLKPRIKLPGRDHLRGVKVKWEKISGPGTVQFKQATQPNSAVRFSKEGLYTLKLSTSYGKLSSSDTVTIKVGQQSDNHYALMLNPLYLLAFDSPANRESAGVAELAKASSAELIADTTILPKLKQGARPFTGLSWDFNNTKSSVKVHNRFNIARLGDVKRTKGLAMSLWFKAKEYKGSFFGNGIISMSSHKYSQGVSINLADLVGVNTEPNTEFSKLFDDQWHHVLINADFSKDYDNVTLFIDGKIAMQKSYTFDKSFIKTRTDHCQLWGNRGRKGEINFPGQLDDIAVFDRSLNQEEISYLFNGPNADHLLSAQKPTINAGKDMIFTRKKEAILLGENIAEDSNLTYQWQLIDGPGPVIFDDPNSAQTKVNFGPLSIDHHNPDYQLYIFRLTAKAAGIAKSNSDELAVVFYKNKVPATRELGQLPPAGQHPRLFFNAADLPQIRLRFMADPYAQRAAKNLSAMYAHSIFNPKSNIGITYQGLKEGKKDVDVKLVVGSNDTRTYWAGKSWLYGQLGGAAAIALIKNDQDQLNELAIVLSRAAHEHLKYYRPNYPNKLVHDASGGLAIAYDLLASNMSEDQRKAPRKLLSKMSKWRQSLGSAKLDDKKNISTNWLTHHDQIVLCALAIEGEEGYDAGLIDQATHKLRHFLTQHGLYKSGYAHEGYTYFRMGMESAALSALALSRRDENLYETTNLYKGAMMMFRSMPPGMHWVTGHGDGSPKIAGMAPIDWLYRYIWPNDPAINTLYGKRLEWLSHQEDGKLQGQFHLMAVLFPSQSKSFPSQKAAAKQLQLNESQLCPDKGYVNARSSWDDNALNLVFRSRQDKYNLGHMHADVNSFELYHNGTTWFNDGGKYQYFNDCHQTILIDGRGGNGSSDSFSWPNLPGHIVQYKNNALYTLSTGDAKAFYDFTCSEFKEKPGKPKAVPLSETGYLWADFVYGKDRSQLDQMPSWRSKPLYISHGSKQQFYVLNPVKKAFRSALVVKGRYPYAIIIDDYQKDEKQRLYEWVGNFDMGTVEMIENSENSIRLKKKGEVDKANELLVLALQADGLTKKPELLNSKLGTDPSNPTKGTKVSQIRITAKSVNPRFKTLLYPYEKGTPQPKLKWSGQTLTVTIANQVDKITFAEDENGITQVDIQDMSQTQNQIIIQ